MILVIYLAALFVTPTVKAQGFSFLNTKKNFFRYTAATKFYSSAGISVSAANYYGDLSPLSQGVSTDISFTRPGLGIFYTFWFGRRYSVKAEFMIATLQGSDSDSADPNDLNKGIYRYRRNLSFRNQIKEFSITAMVDLFKSPSSYTRHFFWTPFVFAGIAPFWHNPETQAPATDLSGNPLSEAGQWVALQPLGTEGQYATLNPNDVNYGIKPYSLFQIAIPFGIGVRFRINMLIDISAEVSFRYTFTDYLDDVSRNYVDLGVLDSELVKALSYRTNELSTPNNPFTYLARDGKIYTVENGYGSEGNIRGKGQPDLYMITTLRISYIFESLHRAKPL